MSQEIKSPAVPRPLAGDVRSRRIDRNGCLRRGGPVRCALLLAPALLAGLTGLAASDPAPSGASASDAGRANVGRIEVVYAGAGDARNHGQWGAVMPAACAERVRIDPAQPAGGETQRSEATGGRPDTAVRVDFDLPVPGWCGLVVLMQDGNWGAQPGPALSAAGATALVFRARGAHGGERVRIKAAIVPDQPFGDSAALPVDSGWIELSSDWRSYRVDASGRDLSRVITPFVVIANDRHNPSGRLSVFFDDIRYEWDR